MKKLLQLFLVAMMSFNMFSLPTFMAKASDLFEYEPHYNYSQQITITKYLGNESEVVFPTEIDGLEVRQVGAYVFDTQEQANTTVTSVVIEEGIEELGGNAFKDYVNLVDIQMNLGLEEINRSAFVNIGAEKVVIPDSVTYIGDQVFNDSVNLKEIEYSKSMTKLVNQIIQGCTSYETFYVPYSVTEIAPAAFDGATALKDIYMGHGVDNIRQGFDDFDVTIHAPLNSYAHTYATDNNIKFEAFEAKCEAIHFNKEQMSLMVGYSDWISSKTTPAYTTDTVKYRSSDESVATVDEFGKVTAVKKGTCFIRVGFGDTSVDYPVVVSNPVTDIVLNTRKLEIAAGDEYQLTDYARSAIAFSIENKILSGSKKDGKTYVNPTNNASRAEAAKMFSVLAGLMK